MNYITVTQLSERWQVTPRYVQNLCKEGRLPGAVRMGKFWMVPEDVRHPADHRRKDASEREVRVAETDDVCRSVLGATYHVPGTEEELLKSLANQPEAQMLTRAQFAYLQGDIDGCSELSGLLENSEDFEIKIGALFLQGICAIYNGDVEAWKRAKLCLENLPCPDEEHRARKEMWSAIYGASIYDMSDYPEWYRQGCFDALPAGYYPAARVHYIKYIYIRGDDIVKKRSADRKDFQDLLFLLPAICEPLISQTKLEKAIVSEIYLRLLCAASYHHAGEDKLAIGHIRRALDLALPDRIYAPFAEQKAVLDSLLDDCLMESSPTVRNKIRSLNVKLMTGWSTVHNSILDRSHTTQLTAKELEAARLAVFGLKNDEIAKRMGISINSVKGYLQVAKDKTGVKKRSELAQFV